jgi:hypothetical protein
MFLDPSTPYFIGDLNLPWQGNAARCRFKAFTTQVQRFTSSLSVWMVNTPVIRVFFSFPSLIMGSARSSLLAFLLLLLSCCVFMAEASALVLVKQLQSWMAALATRLAISS